jgi:2-dehydropantoate 2-reductase
MTNPRVAVLGAGAVGCYFGGMLARAGLPVTLIARPARVAAITQGGLFIDSIAFQETVRVNASTDIASARDADIVLFCVKSVDNEISARALAPVLQAGATVICLQNGVDNAERLRAAAGINALASVVYVASEMMGEATVKHTGRGELIIGDPDAEQRKGDSRVVELERITAAFKRASVPCRMSDNITGDLWTKLVMNCAYNAISALTKARYGQIPAEAASREVLRHAVEEVLAVGRAAGVRFPERDFVQAAFDLGPTMPTALSSTAQDVLRGKRTEIDSLNGFIARKGRELGIATPVNQTLFALVKLLEQSQESALPLVL